MKKIKHYKIVEKLASGGMGEIYKAYDSILERDVAIKVMHSHILKNKDSDAQFMQEARTVAKSTHPNIVTIHEIGQTELGPYIVMELLQGEALSNRLQREGPINVNLAMKLMKQVLDGMHHVHQLGILHRDIKPENILVTADEHAKILDFGISQNMFRGETQKGDISGTVEYSAPEQLLGQDIDHRSDIYAAGIALYQILTAKLPFTSESTSSLLYMKLNQEPEPPSLYNEDVENELDKIVLKAIRKNKEERWQTAREFSDVLDAMLSKDFDKTSSMINNVENRYKSYLTSKQQEESDPGPVQPIFVGREKELKKLVNALKQSAQGQGRPVIVRGEAGVGKSTLAHQFRNYAEKKAVVLYGACLYQEGMDALLPYREALRQFFNGENRTLREADHLQLRDFVQTKAPVLMGFWERFDSGVEAEKKLAGGPSNVLFEAIDKLISFLSTLHPTVFILDDMQWADDASLRLFHYLSRQVSAHRILLIGISRTDRYDLQKEGKPGFLVDVLARIRREVNYQEIILNRLTKESCEILMERHFSPALFSEEFRETIYAETKGNPLFVEETMELLRDKGLVFFKEGYWHNKEGELDVVLPRRIEDVFVRRLSSLTDEEREILQIAAVQGCRVDVSLVAKISETPKIRLLKILQRIERELQIVVGTEEGFQFEHPLLSNLLYQDIPAVLRREYHLMFAAEIEARGTPDGPAVGDLAQHFRRGGEHAKAIPHLYRAGKLAFELSAYRESCSYFENLLDSLEKNGLPVPEDTISLSELYLKLGKGYEEKSLWQQALDAYDKLRQFGEQHDLPQKQVDAFLLIGRINGKLGEWQSALDSCERCLQIAQQTNLDNVLSRIYNNFGVIYFQKGDFQQALRYFELTVQTTDDDQHSKAHALTNMGIIANIQGEHVDALLHYQKALAICEENTDRQAQARIYHNLGMTQADLGEWTRAIQAFERCLKLAKEVQNKQLQALTCLNMGKTFVRKKKLAKAKSYTEKALKTFKRTNDTLNIAEAYHIFGLIYDVERNFPLAEEFFEKSIELNKKLEYREGLAETYVAFGDLCLHLANKDGAREHYEEALRVYKSLDIRAKIQHISKTLAELTIAAETPVHVVPTAIKEKLP